LTGTPLWSFDDRRTTDRNTVVLAAIAVWVFLVLLGLVLTFS
jgi:hypothetical protein